MLHGHGRVLAGQHRRTFECGFQCARGAGGVALRDHQRVVAQLLQALLRGARVDAGDRLLPAPERSFASYALDPDGAQRLRLTSSQCLASSKASPR